MRRSSRRNFSNCIDSRAVILVQELEFCAILDYVTNWLKAICSLKVLIIAWFYLRNS